jgi:uncharacterized protein YbaP (TraB family)
MRNFLYGLLLLAWPAAAQTADVVAHPTLWHVKGPQGDAWLFGSIHILPPQVKWRSPKVAAAIAKSDVFVFETPLDPQSVGKLQALVAANGFLGPRQTLRELLHPQYRDDFDAAAAASGVDPAQLSHERPWLAGLQMMFAQIAKLNFNSENGPDKTLMAEAGDAHKELRYLETMEEQFAVLAPSDAELDLEQFESSLKDLRDVTAEIQPMVDAWSTGDQASLDRLVNGDLDKFPKARKELLNDRNARWLPRIVAMLKEKHTYFITVGAGHLTGPAGVPALLRKAGFKVTADH